MQILATPAGRRHLSRHEPVFEERPVGSLFRAEQRRIRARHRSIDSDIAFLSRHGLPREVLCCATQLAARRGTEARQELLSAGLDRNLYWSALAADLRLPFAGGLSGAKLLERPGLENCDALRLASSVAVEIGGCSTLVVAPLAKEVALLRRHIAVTPELAERIRIAAPETIRAFIVSQRHAALAALSTDRLARALPGLSARFLNFEGGPKGVVLLLAAVIGLALLAPLTTVNALGLLCSLFFVNCSFWKAGAAFRRSRRLRLEPVGTADLPTYTVLVPLFREASVVAELITNLGRLDYPTLWINGTTGRISAI